jgi:hypothetical protein
VLPPPQGEALPPLRQAEPPLSLPYTERPVYEPRGNTARSSLLRPPTLPEPPPPEPPPPTLRRDEPPLSLPPTLRRLDVVAFGFQPVDFVSVLFVFFSFFSVAFFASVRAVFAVLAVGRLPLTRAMGPPFGWSGNYSPTPLRLTSGDGADPGWIESREAA